MFPHRAHVSRAGIGSLPGINYLVYSFRTLHFTEYFKWQTPCLTLSPHTSTAILLYFAVFWCQNSLVRADALKCSLFQCCPGQRELPWEVKATLSPARRRHVGWQSQRAASWEPGCLPRHRAAATARNATALWHQQRGKKMKENTPLWPKLWIFLRQNDNTVLVKIAFPCSREGKGR